MKQELVQDEEQHVKELKLQMNRFKEQMKIDKENIGRDVELKDLEIKALIDKNSRLEERLEKEKQQQTGFKNVTYY